MSTRVGYRALIIDHETYASRLAQFLTRPEYSQNIIQSVGYLYALNDPMYLIEQNDFLYFDPLAFNVADGLRLLAEIQARYPAKAITLFRSGRLWQERLRDIEQMGIAPARLRTMLFLDKDAMVDAAFGQRVRDNILSMEREFLQELQRTGLGGDPLGASRAGLDPLGGTRGLWNQPPWPPDPARSFDAAPLGYSQPGFNQPGYNQPGYNQPGYNQPGYNQPGYNQSPYGQSPYVTREIIEAVVAALGSRLPNPTHPITTPLLPAPQPELAQAQQQIAQLREQMAQLQQQVAQAQRDLPPAQQGALTAQQQVTTLQTALTKQQEHVTAIANAQRDTTRQLAALDARLRDGETRQGRLDQQITEAATARRGTRIAMITGFAALAVAVLAAWIVLILFHAH